MWLRIAAGVVCVGGGATRISMGLSGTLVGVSLPLGVLSVESTTQSLLHSVVRRPTAPSMSISLKEGPA